MFLDIKFLQILQKVWYRIFITFGKEFFTNAVIKDKYLDIFHFKLW